jgi:hypothetical protein
MTTGPAESRLERATREKPLGQAELAEYLRSHGIHHSVDFRKRTLPLSNQCTWFEHCYNLPSFAQLGDLKTQYVGASTIAVLEHRDDENSYHGEVVATIADLSGRSLHPGVSTIYIDAPIDLHKRRRSHRQPGNEDVEPLLMNRGIPVMINSVGFEDTELSFRKGRPLRDCMQKITAFVVDSTGNDGKGNTWWKGPLSWAHQKHNSASHYPPLVVHVGAAVRALDHTGRPSGEWTVEGYSSANSPTFLAPVYPESSLVWGNGKEPEPVMGSSAAAPFVGGVLGALNGTFGPYLSREHILYALMATATPVESVAQHSWKTDKPSKLLYRPNAKGLRYNASYGGFGLIQPEKAYTLLAQMVKLTQESPQTITTPIEDIRGFESTVDANTERDEKGNYVYRLTMPSGLAFKSTIEAEFIGDYGELYVTSPAGTTVSMVMSRAAAEGDDVLQLSSAPRAPFGFSKSDHFGIGTTHAWLGEELGGDWVIRSTKPIRKLEMSQHHFMARDIVKDLDIPALLAKPLPDLSHAVELRQLTGRWQDRFTAPPASGLAGTHMMQQFNGTQPVRR